MPPTEALAADPGQIDEVCKRNANDHIARSLCVSPRPRITGLKELLDVLQIQQFDRHAAMTANSTSLVMRQVNALNPRVTRLEFVDNLSRH